MKRDPRWEQSVLGLFLHSFRETERRRRGTGQYLIALIEKQRGRDFPAAVDFEFFSLLENWGWADESCSTDCYHQYEVAHFEISY